MVRYTLYFAQKCPQNAGNVVLETQFLKTFPEGHAPDPPTEMCCHFTVRVHGPLSHWDRSLRIDLSPSWDRFETGARECSRCSALEALLVTLETGNEMKYRQSRWRMAKSIILFYYLCSLISDKRVPEKIERRQQASSINALKQIRLILKTEKETEEFRT